MNIGRRLKQQREAAGLDIKEAAYRVGKSYQYIRQLEEGINEPPTWELLAKLARIYGSSTDSLLGLGDNMDGEQLNEVLTELLRIVRALPEHRQRDLLELAELFKSRRVEDDTQAMTVILERVRLAQSDLAHAQNAASPADNWGL